MNPRPEAVAAANWWAGKLAAQVRHDVGRGAEPSSALTNSVSALVRRQRADADIEAFREALADEIDQHVAKYSWRPDEPDFGSYMRAIINDYGPDEVLTNAAHRVGFELTTFDLPLKTTMWINPGMVKVAEGHSTRPTIIWRADR